MPTIALSGDDHERLKQFHHHVCQVRGLVEPGQPTTCTRVKEGTMNQASTASPSAAELPDTASRDKLAFERWLVSFMWPQSVISSGPPIRIPVGNEAAGRQFDECLKHGP